MKVVSRRDFGGHQEAVRLVPVSKPAFVEYEGMIWLCTVGDPRFKYRLSPRDDRAAVVREIEQNERAQWEPPLAE